MIGVVILLTGIVHTLGEMPCGGPLELAVLERLHEFLHTLAGFDMHMGVQVGPARVVLP